MKKKNTIIIIGIVLLLVAITTTYILLSNKKIENVSKTSTQAELLTKKLNSSNKLESTITTDKIVLSNINWDIETNTKVHLWIFSDPIDLGEVTIIKDESTYYINSINDTLKTKDIKAGNHKILILKDDKSLGYFNVELTAEKALKVTSTEMPDNTEGKNNENTSSNTQQNTQSSEQSKPEKVKDTLISIQMKKHVLEMVLQMRFGNTLLKTIFPQQTMVAKKLSMTVVILTMECIMVTPKARSSIIKNIN